MLFNTLVFLAAVGVCLGEEVDLKAVQLVPNIIPKEPKATLEVSYGTIDITGQNIELSEDGNLDNLGEEPDLDWEAEEEALYTVLMTDPDAPKADKPVAAEWLHWLVVNVPDAESLGDGNEITPYNGPTPPSGSGFHRYAFMIFKQNGKLDVEPITKRAKFSTKDFLSENKLPEAPEAANYFRAQQ